ncbi:peptidase dimerization domain protein [Leadbetterella byssophila DSM 17132]|uniref:Peptidase dimerization domain protein n=1 Tax=Leadbetterella byssophila (strain DSM 17132 / JCM 16389 / KACC 11308 / NBRC 106382 / 4M15) TaxID=649349 RepID=E4RTV7_LEAB4|nr:dipeptidase [Leadbetterella byssophila]ADQ18665.1 peptidase dimerization domain protein [Leadbetterella byssophila DSM 17132]
MKEYIQANQQRYLDELFDFLRIPSVSADSRHQPDMLRAAEYIKEKLLQAGLDKAEICPTAGHPVVYAEKIVNPEWPTILVYGHYDVQPADPIELWHTSPFEPVIRTTEIHPKGAIFARGACDDKGQIYMHVKAIEAMLKHDALTCNVKIMFEGEEEVGSANLATFVAENKEKLKADIILISDTSIIGHDVPSVETGLRGLAYMEVEVEGPNRDLHSGVYGGAVANPINVLSKMIASLHDEDGRITVKGFYDKVVELSAEERDALEAAPFNLEDYKKDLGIAEVSGEKGYTTRERASIRPTLDVNGIWGGYTGEGSKTVLPSKAFAKISMRLVPDQDWNEISDLFMQHFTAIAPPTVKVKVKPHHGGQPYVTPTDSPGYLAAFKAMQESFGKTPVPTRGGGSIPIVSLFEKELGLKSILLGFGLDSDALHSPNEHYGIVNFMKGIETIPLFYKYFRENFQ